MEDMPKIDHRHDLTRRDFLKDMGMAASGSLLAFTELKTGRVKSKRNEQRGWDLSAAIIVTAGALAHRAEHQAARMLRDAIHQRAGIEWTVEEGIDPKRPAIIIAHPDRVPSGLKIPSGGEPPLGEEEGYTIYLDAPSGGPPHLWLTGGSGRATLYAVGRLLRWLHTNQAGGIVTLPHRPIGLLISTQPHFPLRGHQLGYRNTTNTYDAWTVDQFEQYIRDLLIFGVNSIELIPNLDPHQPASDIMPLTRWEMNRRISALLDSYDLDVWAWLTDEDWDRNNPKAWDSMLSTREKLFVAMPRLDHLFVPGGDPGDMPPEILLAFLEKLAPVLRHVHPNAGLWVSPQGFDREKLATFYQYLQKNQPDWLTGVVYGPWVHDTLAHARQAVPSKYRFRRYPDITHCCRCQYPVPEWDSAYAFTLDREPINPRPIAEAHIHNLFMNDAEGTISYSEGVNDDVNKAIWSERLWDPTRPVQDILVEYGRAFFGAEHAVPVANGLLALEENWQGPLLKNPRPRQALARWRRIWQAVGEFGRGNWRLQQCYFRSLYDVYVQERLIGETRQEEEALKILKQARRIGSAKATQSARRILEQRYSTREIEAMEHEILDLGEALWQSVGMQMSVPLYHAAGEERGAVLDALKRPLNDRNWLIDQIKAVLSLPNEEERLAGLEKLVNWTEPGPGGYYDDLGNPAREPHLVRGEGWERDPGFVRSALDEFGGDSLNYRISWNNQASTLYDTPLEMYYTGLDPAAHYRLRVVYNGRFNALMKLTANGILIHGPLRGTHPPSVMEFPLPLKATRRGELRLKWEKIEGRGCQVAEVWLVKG